MIRRSCESGAAFFYICNQHSTMKHSVRHITLTAALLSSMALFACKSRQHEKPGETIHKDPVTTAREKFAGIEFASKMDLACGMLLTAGIEDTALYKGKVYGFCSEDCKKDFLKTPEAFLASKYRH